MAGHTYSGKQRLCYTEVSDYTNYQGVGADPLYKRYDSVQSVVRRSVPETYWHFLATPEYLDGEDRICWHIEKWTEAPTRLTELESDCRSRYEAIKRDTMEAYRNALHSLGGEELQIMVGAIRYVSDECVYCADGKVFVVAWGMTPDTHKHQVVGAVVHKYPEAEGCLITFDPGEHGGFRSGLDRSIKRARGAELCDKDAPEVVPNEGWVFAGWTPAFAGTRVTGGMTFVATYKELPAPAIPTPPFVSEPEPDPVCHHCLFDAGEHGMLRGEAQVWKEDGECLFPHEAPTVMPEKGYRFAGWGIPPTGAAIHRDTTFTAQYSRIPWHEGMRGWFRGKGCLRWLLWLLLFLLGLWLLVALLDNCRGCGRREDVVVPTDRVPRPDGTMRDDNGQVRPVTGRDGVLPGDGGIVAPVTGVDGIELPIVEQPGAPSVIANRLFLFLEDENDNIESLAADFKKACPGEQYSIIGYDKEVKLLVVQIPEAEREHLRQTLNERIPNHRFLVFDEEVYLREGRPGGGPTAARGWHLQAIRLREGWKITRGSEDVRVAVVDDGIDADHPMFAGRIVEPYNVFTQTNELSLGAGHGTHTAALAVGSDQFYAQGASGVAPCCSLMPIQVFDNSRCPLSAIIAGIMYAIHHGADVVNLSVGPTFAGLNALPVAEQTKIANNSFKHAEKLWARVCKLAVEKNCILVFAAGNDDILASIPPENRNKSAIVVAAVDERLCPTHFTNYGHCTHISAPGDDIYSAFPHGGFKSMDGTSMSAPIVAGTIALMKSLKKDLTTEQARNCLCNTGADVYGWIPPMVLVDKALEGVKSGRFDDPAPREQQPVPDGKGEGGNAGHAPQPAVPIVSPSPAEQSPEPPSGETDYEAIRRMIADYKKKIEELEKLLPNNE